jgi:hypothetical protein
MSNSRVIDTSERWVAPLPEDKKPTTRVTPCLGCGRLPHADELNCLRRRILTLMRGWEDGVERRAELAYTANATEVFGVPPQPIRKRGGESGRFWQRAPVAWVQLPDVFKDKWRKIVRAML